MFSVSFPSKHTEMVCLCVCQSSFKYKYLRKNCHFTFLKFIAFKKCFVSIIYPVSINIGSPYSIDRFYVYLGDTEF